MKRVTHVEITYSIGELTYASWKCMSSEERTCASSYRMIELDQMSIFSIQSSRYSHTHDVEYLAFHDG